MAGRYGVLAIIVVALALTVAPANRDTLSAQEGAQYDLGDIQGMQNSLRLGDLKTAQEKAGIFVDDAHLFERPLVSSQGSQGRRPSRPTPATDLSTLFKNSSVFATFLSMLSQGLNFGAFPGQALALPGGSQFGYAPTDDSYCLFATQPYAPAPSPATLLPGAPTAGSPPLGAFACVDASTKPRGAPPTPDSFTVSYAGTIYVCQGTRGLAPSPIGRKLQQAPVENAIADTLDTLTATDRPTWNCVLSTTPDGTTTLGQAKEAILKDLGATAAHFLVDVYLNADGALTLEQNVINEFMSLADPMWPTQPQLKFTIDFSSVNCDLPLIKESFGLPVPPAAPAAAPGASAAAPGTIGTTPPAASPAATSVNLVNPGYTGGITSITSAPTSGLPSPGLAGTHPVTILPAAPVTLPAIMPLAPTAFDGYLDNCQAAIGSSSNADGNCDRNNNFSAVNTDGAPKYPKASLAMVNESAGQAAHIIPAPESGQCAPLILSDHMQAQFCYDVAILLRTYNSLLPFITGIAFSLAASPKSTLAVFGQAFGLTTEELTTALCIDLPLGSTLQAYNVLGDAVNKVNSSAQGLAVLKTNVELANLVTAGSNLLTNDTSTYATYAILMHQSIAKKVLYSPPSGAHKLLQTSNYSNTTCAVDLTNATTLALIITSAQHSAPTLSDEATRAALNQVLTPAEVAAVGAAVANLNSFVATASDATSVQLGQYYAETTLAPQVSQLAMGEISLAAFSDKTSASAITTALSKLTLPGQLGQPIPKVAVSPATTVASVTPKTQSSITSSSHSGPSNSANSDKLNNITCATVLLIVGCVGVIAIIDALALYMIMSRRNRGPAVESAQTPPQPLAETGPLEHGKDSPAAADQFPQSHPLCCGVEWDTAVKAEAGEGELELEEAALALCLALHVNGRCPVCCCRRGSKLKSTVKMMHVAFLWVMFLGFVTNPYYLNFAIYLFS